MRHHATPALPASDPAADEFGDGGDARRRGGGAAQGHAFGPSPNRAEFFALANQHMRWQLNDLARPDERPAAVELREGLVPAPANSESGITPDGGRMLEAIDNLPEDEREVFGLVRLQGLTHVETAEVLDVSVKTVQRRLNRASLLLAEELDNLRRPDWPGRDPPAGPSLASAGPTSPVPGGQADSRGIDRSG